MPILLTNTLTRQKETLTPLEEGKVKIYNCGPTVYAAPHIGNFRAFLFADLLRRGLEFLGLEVTQIMNITDVGHLISDSDEGEDKLEKGAAKEGVSPLEVARKYEKEFLADMKKLNMLTPHQLPRASEHIKEQVELIKKLAEKGFTYETSDGIYFDTSKFKNYGKLGGQKQEEKKAGKRVEVKSEKKNPADFALWKFCVGENVNHVLRWDFKTGKDLSDSQLATGNSQLVGFPGWHIECSAMSMKYLGDTFDIHTGGVDHIPVHHENEIAQSEAATGKKFVNYWLHNEFLAVDGGKMSKSLGNLYTVTDLESKGFDPLALRYLSLGTHYRTKLNFTWEALKGAQQALTNLREIYQALPEAQEPFKSSVAKFSEALTDDLNSSQALAVAWEVAKNETIEPGIKRATLDKFDEVLALDLSKKEDYLEINLGDEIEGKFGLAYIHGKITDKEKLEKLLRERFAARAKKEWDKSDELREKIEEMGWEILDGGDPDMISQTLKRKV